MNMNSGYQFGSQRLWEGENMGSLVVVFRMKTGVDLARHSLHQLIQGCQLAIPYDTLYILSESTIQTTIPDFCPFTYRIWKNIVA
jgi:hypothetical protein